MSEIQTSSFNVQVGKLCFYGQPWFKENDIASILGYARLGKAIIDHIPDKFKQSYTSLISSVGCPKKGPLDYNDKTTMSNYEVGLYRLMFQVKE